MTLPSLQNASVVIDRRLGTKPTDDSKCCHLALPFKNAVGRIRCSRRPSDSAPRTADVVEW
jgi:hypothetical protein